MIVKAYDNKTDVVEFRPGRGETIHDIRDQVFTAALMANHNHSEVARELGVSLFTLLSYCKRLFGDACPHHALRLKLNAARTRGTEVGNPE